MSPDLEQLLRDTAVRPTSAPDPDDLVARGRRRRRLRRSAVGAGTLAALVAAAVIVVGPASSPSPPEIVDQPTSAPTSAPSTAPDGGDGADGEPGRTETPSPTGDDPDEEEARVARLQERRQQLQSQIDEQAMSLSELRSLESELRFREEQQGEDVAEELAEVAAQRERLRVTIEALAAQRSMVERELAALGALDDPVALARAQATDEDHDLTEGLVALARQPSPATVADVPFADTVELGLADELLREVDREALADPSTWELDLELFRAYTGPFSALDVLADGDPSQTLVGEHRHCASPPMPPPAGFEEHRRVSLQPVGRTSCLEWWTVDLFVADDGQVEAVTMDLYEP